MSCDCASCLGQLPCAGCGEWHCVDEWCDGDEPDNPDALDFL